MLENKIYQNYILEVLKTFFVILFGLSTIALTVRAVNFLDLIVESGYSIAIYFQYSVLNLFGVLTKFVPLSFLLALILFIIKQIQENEFVILWTSGIKKLKLVNLFFFISIFVVFFYIIFSTFLTPFTLYKSRLLLSKEGYDSFIPTIRVQQFSDSFKGFTFLVEEKFQNQIKKIFIYDEANVLKNLTDTKSSSSSTTITAKEGVVEEKKLILFEGQIISSDKNNLENQIIKFEQLNVDLNNLKTDTITIPKFQERTTRSLVKCLLNVECDEKAKKEIITVLNRRLVLPLYIPVVSLICSFLLIKTRSKRESFFINKYSVFTLSFLLLLYAELIIRFTGLSKIISIIFLISPPVLICLTYYFLIFKLSREALRK